MEAIRNREYDPTFEERQRALDSLRRFQDALEGEEDRLLESDFVDVSDWF